MGEIIGKTKIKREKDYLYYVSFDEEGYLLIGRVRSGKRKSKEWEKNDKK